MLLAQVRRTIAERALLQRGEHVLVACSGGADSVSLLHVLHRLRRELGVTVAAASIDHGLRAESADEVAMVAGFAGELGVPFATERLALDDVGSARLSAAAREARYEALFRLAEGQSADAIAVGHTQDDQAETVLARLLRGAGLRGLSGIAPQRGDGVIRPLIDCSRAEVRSYAEYHSLPFIDDPTNDNRAFERARIRHELLPALAGENPQIVRHLADLADEAATVTTMMDEALQGAPETTSRVQPVKKVAALPIALQPHWIARWLSAHTGFRPERTHLVAACRLLRTDGEVLLGSGWLLRRQQDQLVLETRENHLPQRDRP